MYPFTAQCALHEKLLPAVVKGFEGVKMRRYGVRAFRARVGEFNLLLIARLVCVR